MGYFDGEWSITDMTNPLQPALSPVPISLNAPKTTMETTSVIAPKQSATFDPEEGMYDAYIEARNAAIGADASKRKLERFYKKFRKLWDQGEALRKSEFNWNQGMTEANQNIDNARLNILNIGQQTVLNFKNSFKPFENTSKPAVQKPVVPKNEVQTPSILVKTNLDTSLATNPHEGGGSMRHVYNPSNTQETNVTPPVSNNIFSSNTSNAVGKKFTGTFNSMDEFNNAFTDWYGKRKGFWSGGSYSEGKKWDSARDLMLQEYLKFHNLESLPDKRSQQSNNIMNNFYSYFGSLPYKKLGGNINKYQQGGNMNEQMLQAAVIGYMYANKIQPKSEQEVQGITQQVMQLKPQEIELYAQLGVQLQQQKSGVKAKLGAKLNYLNKLKGNCPEGEELVYMKQGGRVCPVCQKKAEKAKSGDKLLKKNAISDFKEKRKQHVNPNDTVHVGGKPKSLTNSDGSRVDKRFPAYTAKDYQNDKKTKDGQKRRMKADLVSSEKCGGKTKKK